MWNWDSFLWPLIVLNTDDMFTLPVGLAMFANQYWTDYALVLAGSTVTVAPVLLVFFLMQKRFIEGITLSGMKAWWIKGIGPWAGAVRHRLRCKVGTYSNFVPVTWRNTWPREASWVWMVRISPSFGAHQAGHRGPLLKGQPDGEQIIFPSNLI